MNRKFAWVIEGDIKACFDEIPHQTILRTIREKVMDNKFEGCLYIMCFDLILTKKVSCVRGAVFDFGELLPSIFVYSLSNY